MWVSIFNFFFFFFFFTASLEQNHIEQTDLQSINFFCDEKVVGKVYSASHEGCASFEQFNTGFCCSGIQFTVVFMKKSY